MKSSFFEFVLQEIPDSDFVGHYLYFRPVNCVLSGFVAEEVPRGLYVTWYIFPLYERAELHMTFSERLPLPRGFIKTAGRSPEDVASDFALRVRSEIEEARERATPQALHDFILNEPSILLNSVVRKTFAYTLIMLEDYSNARYQIDTLQSELREIPENERYPEDDDMIQEIVHLGRLLRADEAKCRQGLMEIVLEMKVKLEL